MARIDSAYAYYMSTYANREVSRYDSHKKSDLRKVYSSIVKSNKDSPLYKLSDPNEAARCAIDIKEHAKTIQNAVAYLTDSADGLDDSFQKKVAMSSDEDIVSVKYIGDGSEGELDDHFNIRVDELATPQMNMGNFIPDNEHTFDSEPYSFDLVTNSSAYEFQYSVTEDEMNIDVLNKLARLVNTSNLGITANVLSDGQGSSALSLRSHQTGLSSGEDWLFAISPDGSTGSVKAMKILGIDRITDAAHNSSFLVNGSPHSSLSNTFTINNAFELTLHDTTGSNGVDIGFKTNAEAVADNIQTLVDAYNDILTTAESYEGDGGRRLYLDMAALSQGRQVALEGIGLMVGEDGGITVDRDILADAVSPERSVETFSTLSSFRDSVGTRADEAAIDPMRYVNKVVVAYKNPETFHFATPYITSIYAGMMLDNYV